MGKSKAAFLGILAKNNLFERGIFAERQIEVRLSFRQPFSRFRRRLFASRQLIRKFEILGVKTF
jgi:hypothetical protein